MSARAAGCRAGGGPRWCAAKTAGGSRGRAAAPGEELLGCLRTAWLRAHTGGGQGPLAHPLADPCLVANAASALDGLVAGLEEAAAQAGVAAAALLPQSRACALAAALDFPPGGHLALDTEVTLASSFFDVDGPVRAALPDFLGDPVRTGRRRLPPQRLGECFMPQAASWMELSVQVAQLIEQAAWLLLEPEAAKEEQAVPELPRHLGVGGDGVELAAFGAEAGQMVPTDVLEARRRVKGGATARRQRRRAVQGRREGAVADVGTIPEDAADTAAACPEGCRSREASSGDSAASGLEAYLSKPVAYLSDRWGSSASATPGPCDHDAAAGEPQDMAALVAFASAAEVLDEETGGAEGAGHRDCRGASQEEPPSSAASEGSRNSPDWSMGHASAPGWAWGGPAADGLTEPEEAPGLGAFCLRDLNGASWSSGGSGAEAAALELCDINTASWSSRGSRAGAMMPWLAPFHSAVGCGARDVREAAAATEDAQQRELNACSWSSRVSARSAEGAGMNLCETNTASWSSTGSRVWHTAGYSAAARHNVRSVREVMEDFALYSAAGSCGAGGACGGGQAAASSSAAAGSPCCVLGHPGAVGAGAPYMPPSGAAEVTSQPEAAAGGCGGGCGGAGAAAGGGGGGGAAGGGAAGLGQQQHLGHGGALPAQPGAGGPRGEGWGGQLPRSPGTWPSSPPRALGTPAGGSAEALPAAMPRLLEHQHTAVEPDELRERRHNNLRWRLWAVAGRDGSHRAAAGDAAGGPCPTAEGSRRSLQLWQQGRQRASCGHRPASPTLRTIQEAPPPPVLVAAAAADGNTGGIEGHVLIAVPVSRLESVARLLAEPF